MKETKFKNIPGIDIKVLKQIDYARKLLDSADVPKDITIYMRKDAFDAFMKSINKDAH